ncbi:MAG: carboxymuconolactone decarboxylase family protein, partial [Bacteroidales bacterium]|nr:carboxymuconolactone decarboxylase family protein [Bacteroidales bacterium]
MKDLVNDFREYRKRMNERILAHDNKSMKRLYSLD